MSFHDSKDDSNVFDLTEVGNGVTGTELLLFATILVLLIAFGR